MSRNILSGRLLGIFQVLSSAIEAAGAADAGRAARPRALRRLGIDPDQYGRIGRN
jgi:hypothetical protein